MLGNFSRTAEAMESRNRALCDMQVWPTSQRLDWRGWLVNFPEADLPYARCLLEAFVYLNNEATDALFIAAFRSLSRTLGPFDDPTGVRQRWKQFLDDVLVVIVEGEIPSPTDSGYLFARRARNLAGIPSDRIVLPGDAIRRLSSNSPKPIVFVDDFVGSGSQFTSTWEWPHHGANGQWTSFRELAASGSISAYYIPLVATQYGIERIRYDCADIKLLPVHVLNDEYNCADANSLVWRPDLQAGVRDFLERAAIRAGLDYHSTLGFHQLALAIGFEHGVPDATLKLFSHSSPSWRPLIRPR